MILMNLPLNIKSLLIQFWYKYDLRPRDKIVVINQPNFFLL
jgi:hypothetical protein